MPFVFHTPVNTDDGTIKTKQKKDKSINGKIVESDYETIKHTIMTNDEIKKYLKNELPLMERVRFIEELENDLFLKESMKGLEMWVQNNKHKTIEELEEELNKRIFRT